MRWRGAGQRVLRWVLWTLVLWVVIRGVVSLLPAAPEPTDAARENQSQTAQVEPPGLRAFPAMFAREYLTWKPDAPDERAARLRPYLATGLDSQGGWTGGEGVGQRAEATWVYGLRPVSESRWLVTVAARVITVREEPPVMAPAAPTQTAPAAPAPQVRTIFLAVPVSQTKSGGLVVYEYPALVPPPAAGELSDSVVPGQETTDQGDRVKTLLTGFFKAYLENGDVTYYLTPGTQIATVSGDWRFDRVAKVTLFTNAGEVRAVADVAALDTETGARFTYRYTLLLAERDGRWYVGHLQQKGE